MAMTNVMSWALGVEEKAEIAADMHAVRALEDEVMQGEPSSERVPAAVPAAGAAPVAERPKDIRGLGYAKLRDGSWGVRVGGADRAEVAPGTKLRVPRKDGTVTTATVARVLSKNGDAVLCSIERDENHVPAQRQGAGERRGGYRRPGGSSGGGRCRGCRGPIKNAPHCRAQGGYCGECAYDEF